MDLDNVGLRCTNLDGAGWVCKSRQRRVPWRDIKLVGVLHCHNLGSRCWH